MTRAEIRSQIRRDRRVRRGGAVSRYAGQALLAAACTFGLAFAVAAHLEPEILVVDEVLAVGDAEFQKKCLGKMGEVARRGRTVLFVSHNMNAVERLCQRVICLKDGRIAGIYDEVREGIVAYLRGPGEAPIQTVWDNPGDRCENDFFFPKRFGVSSATPNARSGEPFSNEHPIVVTIRWYSSTVKSGPERRREHLQ